MVGVNKNRIGHDDIYEATVVIEGGQLVVPAAGATLPGKQGIAVAGAGAVNVLGVAGRRAVPHADLTDTSETNADGYPTLQVNPVNELTVVYKRCVVEVTYNAAAVGFGAKLAAGAGGNVRAYDEATMDTSEIVGECRVVGGMGAGGGKGFAYIY